MDTTTTPNVPTDRPWGVYHEGRRIGTVNAATPVEAFALAQRLRPELGGVVVSPDPEAPAEGKADGKEE